MSSAAIFNDAPVDHCDSVDGRLDITFDDPVEETVDSTLVLTELKPEVKYSTSKITITLQNSSPSKRYKNNQKFILWTFWTTHFKNHIYYKRNLFVFSFYALRRIVHIITLTSIFIFIRLHSDLNRIISIALKNPFFSVRCSFIVVVQLNT